MTSFIAIVPARLASTRLPNKPLADVAGLPMVVHVARRALQSGASRVVVAVDDKKTQSACATHGIEALMTSANHSTGTDRLAEVVQSLKLSDDDIVVNVQGDEPLIPPELINEVAHTLSTHPQAAIATAALAIIDPGEINNPNVVKVVFNQAQEALYFSRAPIPFTRNPKEFTAAHFRHIGIYAYRAGFLKAFSQLPPAPIEQAESLEQLRALYNGYKIAVMITPTAPPPGVDTAEDLEEVRKRLGH